MNGEVANYYRRPSTLSYHPSMAVRRSSLMSENGIHPHPHVPNVHEVQTAPGGNYNYGYEEMVQQQEYDLWL